MTADSVCVAESSPPADSPKNGWFSVPEQQLQCIKDRVSMGHFPMDQINRWFDIHLLYSPNCLTGRFLKDLPCRV